MDNEKNDHHRVSTTTAPQPIGPYVQGVSARCGGTILFVSGQAPADVESQEFFRGDAKRQTAITLRNIEQIVLSAGYCLDDIVKCNVYVTDLQHFAAVNEAYAEFFSGHRLPARTTVQVAALPKQVDVEIEAIAIKP